MQVSQSLTDALKFTAPFTMETCTDEVAALRAFVNVVHMTELQPKIKAKQIPLVISKDVYKAILASRSGRTVSFFEVYMFRHTIELPQYVRMEYSSSFIRKKLCKHRR